jgi:hypothetical protein
MQHIKLRCALASLLMLTAFNQLFAQVPVRNEPRHKVILENEYVRLLDVHIQPHDTTLVHIHAAPSVIVFLTRSSIATQIVGAAPVNAEVQPAQTGYAAYDEKPITHRVYNRGDSTFHVMDIELVKKTPAPDSCSMLSDPAAKVTQQQKLVRVYNIDLDKNKKLQIPKSSCAHLIIAISGKIGLSNVKKSIGPGDFLFYEPQTMIEIVGQEDAKCVLLELK